MKKILEENKGIPASLLLMLAIIAGISVANLYYNQPLLNKISEDLHVSEFTANLIPMTTQIGYALGLLFIIPLGDLYKRRNIIVINFLLLSVSMSGFAMARNIHFILLASLITGICSVMPQIFIPIAAQFSQPEKKSTKCRRTGERTANRYSRITSCQRHCGRILGMAHNLLHSFYPDVNLYICYHPYIA